MASYDHMSRLNRLQSRYYNNKPKAYPSGSQTDRTPGSIIDIRAGCLLPTKVSRFSANPRGDTSSITAADPLSDNYIDDSNRFKHGYMRNYGSGRPISQQKQDKINRDVSRWQRGCVRLQSEIEVKKLHELEVVKLQKEHEQRIIAKRNNIKDYQDLLDLKAGFANDRMSTSARYDLHVHPATGEWTTDPSFGNDVKGGGNISQQASFIIMNSSAAPHFLEECKNERWMPMSQNAKLGGRAYAP